jgi:dipeptidyl aminopeptidase/acylaminoacyl peptidase
MAFIVIGLLIANSTTVFSQPDNLPAATKSPANEWVILASGTGELFYWSPNLQNPQRLVATNGHNTPVISPSHTMISYAKSASIWLMDLDGSNPRKVAEAGERIDSIAWAPSGKRLAFIAGQTIDVNTQRTTIYTVDVTGQNFKGVATASGDALVGDIGWTPDGMKSPTRSITSRIQGSQARKYG